MFQNVMKLISFKSYNMFDGILKHKEEIDLFGKKNGFKSHPFSSLTIDLTLKGLKTRRSWIQNLQ